MQRQIISILVEDQPGVLSRVSGILSSRGHNINSLSVCGTEIRGLSRMTVDFETEDSAKENTIRRIEGVEEVLAVLTVTRDRMVEREVALLKMSTEPPPGLQDAVKRLQARHDKRQALMSLAELFDGKILDIGDSHATICLTSWSKRYARMFGPFFQGASARFTAWCWQLLYVYIQIHPNSSTCVFRFHVDISQYSAVLMPTVCIQSAWVLLRRFYFYCSAHSTYDRAPFLCLSQN